MMFQRNVPDLQVEVELRTLANLPSHVFKNHPPPSLKVL